MTTEIREGVGRRRMAASALLAGVAMAVLFISSGSAHAQDATTTTTAPTTTQSTTAAPDTTATGSAPATSAAAPQDSSTGTPSSSDATATPTTSAEPTTTSTPVYGPAKTARLALEAKAAARKANKANGTAGTGDAGEAGTEAPAPAIQTDDGGGPVTPLIQTVTIGSDGIGYANTGNNTVAGNRILVIGPANQKVRLFGLFRGPIVVSAVNNQTVTNNAMGIANATTGDANSTGTSSTTGVTQTIGPGSSSGGGVAATGQNAAVTNTGHASADTGGNTVIGNDVTVNAPAVQIVRNHGPPGGRIGSITLINDQDVRNDLDGHASATTGDANATGTTANTNVGQAQGSGAGGSGGTQGATVTNTGTASANTGNNTVIGNNVVVNIPVNQVVRLFGIFRGAITVTMVNNQSVVNNLTGSASLVTGNANATGVMATTSLDQSQGGSGAGGSGGAQSASVTNTGTASANTGNNTVIGNNVIINMPVNQIVRFFGVFRGPITITMVNNQSIVNNLTGSASLVTGNATATGVIASTSITQAMGSASGRDSDGTDARVKRAKKHGHGAAAARAHVRRAGRGRTSGELPRTGGSLAVLTLVGLGMIALGGLTRRSVQTA